MNALLYAVNEIKSTIPIQLLHAGMMFDEQEQTANLTSLDEKILTKVIRKRVLLDANIVGGIETIIPLNGIQPSFYEYFYTIYNIPNEYTMNKQIISVLSLSHLPVNSHFGSLGGLYGNSGLSPNNGFSSLTNTNPLMSVTDRIGNASSSQGIMNNTHLELVAYNTVLVYAHYRVLANFALRVVLENESNLNNIQPRSYKNLGILCSLATKAYLYNKLIIPINSGYLSGGQDLGMFKSILESYSSSEEDYNTYLREVWASVAFQNDTQRNYRFLSSMIAPDL